MILKIRDDFDLDRIADSGQCFRWQRLESGIYRIPHAGRCLYAEQVDSTRFAFSCPESEFDGIWRAYFDFDQDYRAIRARIDPAKDPFLSAAAERGKGIRILRQDPWETLISFIISQNRNIPAIRMSVERLCEACGEARTDARGEVYRAFPTPEAIAALGDEALAGCRLGYRAKYVRAAAQAVAFHRIDLKALKSADEDTAIAELTALYGVGVKVASCVSLFGLHHTNAFPLDVWMKRVLAAEYPKGYPYDAYSPWNGVYQQYMFSYYRNRKART